VDWNAVVEFVRSRAAAAAQAIAKVPEEDIRSTEQELHVSLPPGYRGFLAVMGRRNGDFQPFGWSQDHDLYALRQERSHQATKPPRYFRVTRETDEMSIGWVTL
jgi:hypothetical protein